MANATVVLAVPTCKQNAASARHKIGHGGWQVAHAYSEDAVRLISFL